MSAAQRSLASHAADLHSDCVEPFARRDKKRSLIGPAETYVCRPRFWDGKMLDLFSAAIENRHAVARQINIAPLSMVMPSEPNVQNRFCSDSVPSRWISYEKVLPAPMSAT